MPRVVPAPFLKWAGGKYRLSGKILSRLPDSIETYYEPFLGGGAVFFELARSSRFRRAVIGDSNSELINTWYTIKNDVSNLIKELKGGFYEYNKPSYLKIRKLNVTDLNEVQRAARFIYLNRTCFNGLYRVNQSGNFNVPFGKYSNPIICDEVNLIAVSKVLQEKVEIRSTGFEETCKSARLGDAVYFDPPYIPASKTSKFTQYTSQGFGLEKHTSLRDVFKSLSMDGVKCVLSNSSTEESMDLYKDFPIEQVSGFSGIGGPASFRKSVKEIIVHT